MADVQAQAPHTEGGKLGYPQWPLVSEQIGSGQGWGAVPQGPLSPWSLASLGSC